MGYGYGDDPYGLYSAANLSGDHLLYGGSSTPFLDSLSSGSTSFDSSAALGGGYQPTYKFDPNYKSPDDSSSSTLGSIGDFLSKNSSWLVPAGVAAASALNNSSARNSLNDVYKGMTDKKFADAQALDAYNKQYTEQAMAAAAANAASRRAAAAARAKAARQEEKNRQNALKKSKKVGDAAYDKALSYFEPYRQTGLRLLPIMESLYGEGAKGLSSLGQMYLNPEALAKTQQSTPAYQVNIPLPDYLKYGK